jgi:hypothetical protein
MMAVPRRRGTRALGQRAGRIVRPPSSRFFAKLSAAGLKSLLSWGKPRKRLPQVSNCVIDLLLKHRCFLSLGNCLHCRLFAPFAKIESDRNIPKEKTGVARRQSTGPADEVEISARQDKVS